MKKNATENDYKSISEPLDFKIFLGGHAPLAARAFGTRDLPRLFLKSGYGPVSALIAGRDGVAPNKLNISRDYIKSGKTILYFVLC